ncbi:MAG: hypothetical protein J7K31_02610 [Candidatus Aenigmarchaeota archaeon]|nr:hypothetical protein [Candidatus Aenigmarchaeota archaeon]
MNKKSYKRKVFVFGSHNDPQAWNIADKIKKDFPAVDFVKTEDPFVIREEKDVVLMDVVNGLDKPQLLSENDIKSRRLSTLHDMDLGFVISLLKTMKEIRNIKIIGIPFDAKADEVKKLCLKLFDNSL